MKKYIFFNIYAVIVILLTFSTANNSQAQVTVLTEGFESGTVPPTGWVSLNGGTGNVWANFTSGSAHTGTKAAECKYHLTNAANAWLISPGYALTAGTEYNISYWEKTYSSYPESLKLTVGTAQTIAGQTTTLQDCGSHLSSSYVQRTATFTPGTSGTYYFGWNCYSAANMNYQDIDDILITYSVACSGTPTGGTTTASATSGCSSYTSNLSVTGGSAESGITYQWESSVDNTSYSTVSGATSATYTATVSSGVYYRRGTRCTASGLTGYSTPIQLTITTVPSNDLCANATPLPCGTTNLAGYTNCTASETAPLGKGSNYGVWYTFVGDGYSTTISSTANFDHEMTIITGTCGGTYALVISKDLVLANLTETYTFYTAIGTTYYVYIAHCDNPGTSTNTGTFTISRSCIIPCSGTPTAGTATAAATSFTCSGSTTVSLSGYSTDTGISFLWQSSPAGTNTWSDIATATTNTLTTGTISASTDYRCKVTCANGGAVDYSSTATVIINANAPGRAIASLETVCSGGTTYLSLIGSTISNSTYQWQSSADTLTWSDISGATASTLTTAGISSNTYFRCKIKCTASATFTYSRWVFVSVITTSPGNDECANAILLPVNSSNICTSSAAGTIQCATGSPEANTTCGATLDDDDVWYKFVATQTTHLISLFNITGSTTDMTIALYSGTCGTLANFSCLNDDQSNVTGLTVGATYYARVYTNSSTAGQTTAFEICIGSIPVAPSNDECANATTITVNTTSTCADYVSGTVYSATASTQGTSCGGSDDDDVWFQFVATDTIHNISLTNIYGSTTDMYFTVSSGNCTTLTSLLCSEENAAQLGGLTIGNTYYIRVYTTTSTGGQTSAFDLCVSSIAPTAYCKGADPFCTGTTYNFPTNINAGTGQTGPDYGCLCSQPNPVWYFLRIATAGAIQIEIESSCGDVDYAAWGPFSAITCNPDSLISTVGACSVSNIDSPAGRMVDCAYSTAPIEYLDIPDAQVGEYYLVMINNYANCAGMYTFNKTAGLGCTDCNIIMPIELLYFNGECINNETIRLKWGTASETNNDYFIIEGSSDAKKYTKIGNIKGAGNSTTSNTYIFSDITKQGFSYYQLTQVDFDGNKTRYNPIHVDCYYEKSNTIKIFPNPTSNGFSIHTESGENLDAVQIYSTSGLKVKDINMVENNQMIDVSDLPKGLYLVKAIVKGEVICLKLNLK